jgi:hypothetical protein
MHTYTSYTIILITSIIYKTRLNSTKAYQEWFQHTHHLVGIRKIYGIYGPA